MRSAGPSTSPRPPPARRPHPPRPAEHIAVLTIHHIVADGWSMGVLVAELAQLYEALQRKGGRPLPPVLPLPACPSSTPTMRAGSALGSRAGARTPAGARWRGRFAPATAACLLEAAAGRHPSPPRPANRPAPPRCPVEQWPHGHLPLLARALRQPAQLSRKQGVTLFMTLLAGYQALLARYSGQGDIVVGSALANRQRAEVEPLIGFFVNTLVFRTKFDPSPNGPLTFKELLARVRETALAAYAAPGRPVRDACRCRPRPRTASSPSATSATPRSSRPRFSLQNVPVPVRELPGLTLEPVNLDKGIAGYDMLLQVTETDTPEGRALACAWEYNSDLFDRATIERMAGHLQALFAAAVADPTQPIAALPLLTEAERRTMLVEWNATAVPLDLRPHAPQPLRRAGRARIPDAPAAIFAVPGGQAESTRTLSYRELDRRGEPARPSPPVAGRQAQHARRHRHRALARDGRRHPGHPQIRRRIPAARPGLPHRPARVHVRRRCGGWGLAGRPDPATSGRQAAAAGRDTPHPARRAA